MERKKDGAGHLGVLQGDCEIEIYENGKKVPAGYVIFGKGCG